MNIPIPKSRFGQLSFFFATQFVSYFLFVANTRAFTQGSYAWTWLTDTMLAGQAFAISKLMIDNKDARGLWAGIGYTLGGPMGSILSIFVTKHLYGR
jgi:hypothetical protein